MSQATGDSERLNSIISRIMGAGDEQGIKDAYREWAASYDQDLDGFGYVAPQIGVELFDTAFANPDGLVLDAGCGTGLCGQALAERGYTRIHGADFSTDMLAVARGTGHYEALVEADFRNPLHMDNATYDGILSIGVYKSFIGVGFLSELIRVTKPNGIICMSCRFNYFEGDLAEQIVAEEQLGTIVVESQMTRPYLTGQKADAVYLVLRKR